MEEKAKQTTELRARIAEKAKLYIQDEAQTKHEQLPERGRKGLKYSTAANNPEGTSEKELRALSAREKPAGKKYKPRHRSQLSSEEIEEIVQSYNEGNLTQLEVAK